MRPLCFSINHSFRDRSPSDSEVAELAELAEWTAEFAGRQATVDRLIYVATRDCETAVHRDLEAETSGAVITNLRQMDS